MGDETNLRRHISAMLAVGAAAVLGVVLATSGNGTADVVVPAAPAVAADAAPPEAAAPHCTVRQDGNHTDRGWLDSGGGKEARHAVGAALRERFYPGSIGKKDPAKPVRDGFFGEALDYVAHELVIVVDPTVLDGPALEREMRALAAPHLAGADASDLAIRVQAGCHSGAELARARDVIVEEKWVPASAEAAGYSFSLSAYTSTYEVGIDERAGRALKAELGDLVTIDEESRVVPGVGRDRQE